jgi:hypothetical protein
MISVRRLSSDAGIAIGPILFVLAILALIAAVMVSGNGDFQVAGGEDRITNDIVAQANLIRSTINQCNMQYTINVSTQSVGPVGTGDYYPRPYPTASTPTAVSALVCNPLQGSSATSPVIWNDPILGNKLLPPPTQGFNAWQYVDAWSPVAASDGGRCFYIVPSVASPSGQSTIVNGLTRAASKFNSSTSYSATTEAIYDPASTSQKFVIWITVPQTGGTPNSNCLP